MNYTCAACKSRQCIKAPAERGELPANCPMRDEAWMATIQGEYMTPEVNDFYVNAGHAAIHCKENRLPRIMEMVELCRRMGYRHIGIASCIGSAREADICAKIFRREGFEVDTVICCCGGLNELDIGVDMDPKFYDGPDFAAACNPIGQAQLLQKAGTDFNIVMGLCVGHDALFFRHSHVLCTVLNVKDRAFPHNPIAGVYYAYGCVKTGE